MQPSRSSAAAKATEKQPAPMFATTPDITFGRYFAELGKAKSFDQWKPRALVVHVPQDAALSCRTVNDVGRMMGLMFIAASAPRDEITADLRGKDVFISEHLATFLTRASWE